jgi:hypothetical protein
MLYHQQIMLQKNGFLNDLINSGNLGLIKNNVLRNLLSSWISELIDLEEKEDDTGRFNDA